MEDNNKTYLQNFEEIIAHLNHHACRMPNVRVSFTIRSKMTVDDLQPFVNAIEEVRYYISRTYVGYCVLKNKIDDKDEIKKLYEELSSTSTNEKNNQLPEAEKNLVLIMPEQQKLNEYVIKINKFLVDELNKYKTNEKVLGDVVR